MTDCPIYASNYSFAKQKEPASFNFREPCRLNIVEEEQLYTSPPPFYLSKPSTDTHRIYQIWQKNFFYINWDRQKDKR